MRVLAILSSAFSAAVFLACYLLPEGWLLPAGLVLILSGAALALVLRKRPRRRLAALLVCWGAAAGLLWTAAYTVIFFQPARELDGRTVMLSGTVAEYPQEEDYGWSVLVRAETEGWVTVDTVLYVDEQGMDLRPGDNISSVVHCTLADRTFSGEEITYYTAKGVFLRGEAYGRLEIQRPERVPLRDWPALLARVIRDGIDAAFPPEAAPLVRALVTGNRDTLTDQFTTSLERTGLSHTVAVSGMHLAFLASMISLLMGRGKRSTALVTAVCVLAFCGVAGSTPSVVRSAVMILLLQAAPLLGRERDGPTSLFFALMLLLIWNPFSAAHIGLQLSFGAVAGILLLSDRIQDWLSHRLGLDRRAEDLPRKLLRPVLRFGASTLSATLGASVLTVPLVAIHFQNVSLISPLSNLLTLWAVSWLFSGGMMAGLLAIALPGPAAVLALPLSLLARYLVWIIQWLGALPFSAIPLDSFYYRAWVVFLYLLVVGAVLLRGRRLVIPLCAGVSTLMLALICSALSFQRGPMTAVVLDVGQGQSVLLRMGNFLVLSDCGGDGYDDPGDVAADYIQSLGRGRLDLLVVSHYHADHANGVPQLLRRLEVGEIALPDVEEDSPLRQEILTLAEEQGCTVRFIRSDTTYTLEEGQAVTLYAPRGQGTDTNELGLTLLASAGDFDALITGDMSGAVEELLLAHTDLPDVELLVAGHHGSATSTTQALLDRTRPEAAVISVGLDNRYGHPAPDTLLRLAQAGAEIYRTDLQGTVTVRAGD